MRFDAFHLPMIDAAGHTAWLDLNGGARAPALQPDDIGHIVAELRKAGEVLRTRPVEEIIHAIDAAAALLVENDGTREALIARVAHHSGYSPGMTAHVIDHMIADWREPALRELLLSEFPDTRVLDGFHALSAGQPPVHARGAGVALHIFSGNVPGVAVTSMIRSLLVKCPVLGKTASGEPVLPVLFARALARVDPRLGESLAVTYWQGGDAGLEDAALRLVDQVVHYGGREALASVRGRMPPRVRMVEHGPRISFGIVGRGALDIEAESAALAADIAYATAVFDQQGCVSPHTVFVERGGRVTPEDLAAFIDRALTALAGTFPPAILAPSEAAAIREVRLNAEFRAIAGEKVSVKGPDRLGHTIIFDPVPALTVSCLNRTLRVCPIDSVEEVPLLVAPFRDILQSVAVAGVGESTGSLSQGLSAVGATRISSFRSLPWPRPSWRHDGRGPLSELVYWTEIAP